MATSRKLFVSLGINSKRLSSGLKKSEKMFSSFGKKIQKGLGKTFAGLKIAAGGGAAIGFASAAVSARDFEQTLENLRVQAEKTVGGMGSIRSQIDSVSSSLGVDRNDLVQGVAELVDLMGSDALTGNNISVIGRAMLASGAEARDLAKVMLGLNDSLKLDPKDAEKALGIILSIGKKGSVPLAEMAQILPKAAASWSQAGGSQDLDGLTKLVAALQVAKPAFGGAAEGATGLAAVVNQLAARHKEIKKVFGVDVFQDIDGNISQRGPMAILEEMGEAEASKDPRKIMAALGRNKEARKMFNTYLSNQDKLSGLEGAADGEKINRDVIDRLQSPVGKLNRSYAKMKLSMAKAFTPERIEKFAAAIEKLADVVSALVDNMGTMLALWAGSKLGPGMASMAFGSAGAMGKTGAGSAINAVGKGSLKGLGLVAAAGAAGYALGTFADRVLGLSDGISDAAVAIFGVGDVARAKSNRVETLDKELASGEIDKKEYDKRFDAGFNAFAFRFADATADIVGTQSRAETGQSLEEQRKRVQGLGTERLAEYREIARLIAVAQNEGRDFDALADRLASIIAGQKIDITMSGDAIQTMIDNGYDVRTST